MYRAIQPSFDLTAALKGKRIEQPSFFLGGAEDGLTTIYGGLKEDKLRQVLPGLIGFEIIPGVAH